MRNVERFRELCRQAESEKQPSRLDEIAKQMLELLEQEFDAAGARARRRGPDATEPLISLHALDDALASLRVLKTDNLAPDWERSNHAAAG